MGACAFIGIGPSFLPLYLPPIHLYLLANDRLHIISDTELQIKWRVLSLVEWLKLLAVLLLIGFAIASAITGLYDQVWGYSFLFVIVTWFNFFAFFKQLYYNTNKRVTKKEGSLQINKKMYELGPHDGIYLKYLYVDRGYHYYMVGLRRRKPNMLHDIPLMVCSPYEAAAYAHDLSNFTGLELEDDHYQRILY